MHDTSRQNWENIHGLSRNCQGLARGLNGGVVNNAKEQTGDLGFIREDEGCESVLCGIRAFRKVKQW